MTRFLNNCFFFSTKNTQTQSSDKTKAGKKSKIQKEPYMKEHSDKMCKNSRSDAILNSFKHVRRNVKRN